MTIKKGDTVIVITGSDRGKTGKVLLVLPRRNRVVIEGVNVKKRHEKPRRSNQKGQIVEKSLPIHASNVMLLDEKTGKRTRVSVSREGGKRTRISRKSRAVV